MEKTIAEPLMENGLTATPAAEHRSERCRPPGPCAAPWLVFPHGKSGKDHAFYNLCDPSQKTYLKSIPEMRRSFYWQHPSHQGWLVMSCYEDNEEYYSKTNCKYGDCFLWNPVTLGTVQLPSLRPWFDSKPTCYIRDCLLSSPPYSHDSMVFFLFVDNQISKYFLLFCRPGVDNQWRTKELYVSEKKKNYPRSLICYNGKLYIMCFKNPHLVIEKIRLDEGESLVTKSIKVSDIARFEIGIVGNFVSRQSHYVESCGELFQVDKEFYATEFDKEVVTIRVYRLNFSSLAWENVKSLGDHVLFLGVYSRASCSATDLGLTRGCVYYTNPNDKSLYKFDLEDGSISVSLPCPNLPTPWSSPDWVLMPRRTMISDADERRRAEDKLGSKEEKDNIVVEEHKKCNMYNHEKAEDAPNNTEGEIEEATLLSMLNEEILELVANASVSNALNLKTSSIDATTQTTTPLSPWFVSFKKNDGVYNFIDPMQNNKKHTMNFSELLLDAHIRFSKGGWLLMSKVIEQQRVTVENNYGEKLVGLLHDTGSTEIVILCHGFRSTKESGLIANLADAITKQGISVFRFDFSGNGESEGVFRYGYFRREADDIRSVVLHFSGMKRVIAGILGHSKGGNVVLLYASQYKDAPPIVNVSGRFDLESGTEGRLGKDFMQRIKENGFIDAKGKDGKVLYRVTEEGLMEHLATDMHAACISIEKNCRVLTVHGSKDKIVPVESAMEFAKIIPNHKLCIVKKADHSFSKHLPELAEVVVNFIKESL